MIFKIDFLWGGRQERALRPVPQERFFRLIFCGWAREPSPEPAGEPIRQEMIFERNFLWGGHACPPLQLFAKIIVFLR